MNIYWKTIILSMCLIFLFPKNVRAAEFPVFAGCKAEWADEERGIARITLTQHDEPHTELVNGRTNYIFMVDGSRTTTLNDKYLHRNGHKDTEPMESHCPCMADGHYYLIDGTKVFPVTHTLGYETATGNLRTWSSRRKVWADSAGAHYNGNNKRIAVRYGNGCLDIFTIFKNTAIGTIQKIAARNDGSKVAFLSFSGEGGELYGVLDYTSDYGNAAAMIRNAEFLPGSCICPGIDRARSIYDQENASGATKIFIMGDGRNHDMDRAQQKAEEFRSLPGVTVYSACMGIESAVKGSGYDAMYALNGRKAERFWRIRTSPSADMEDAFAEVIEEKVPVKVSLDDKCYTGKIGSIWDYYENAGEGFMPQCSHGIFSHNGGKITWIIPQSEGRGSQCVFYLRLKEDARYVAEEQEYEVIEEPELTAVIRGGLRDGQPVSSHPICNPLRWKPSEIQVTKAALVSGISSHKEGDVWYVKGGSRSILEFTSYVKYACARWKPEGNILYERSSGGGLTECPEKECDRSEDLGRLRSRYTAVLYNDKEIREYYPRAFAGSGKNILYTKQFDEQKKLTLICDAVPPEIEGAIPERIREDTVLKLRVKDDGSGVRKGSFVLELFNRKTGEKKLFTASGTEISWNIRLDDPFYSGNICWSLQAEDRVTNQTIKEGVSNIRAAKSEETIANEIRTRIL